MIRRLNESDSPPVPSDDSAFPSLEQPFALEERPPGVRFYIGRTSWFHPYALLQNMNYTADSLKLVFADTDVVIRGRGLHELYRRLLTTASPASSSRALGTPRLPKPQRSLAESNIPPGSKRNNNKNRTPMPNPN